MSEQILNTITSNVQQLINMYVVSNVNTGNRTVDNALTVIINSMYILIGTFLYNKLAQFIVKYTNKVFYKETDEPTSINIDNFPFKKYQISDIKKYKFVVTLYYINYDIWMKKNKIKIHSYNQMKFHLCDKKMEKNNTGISPFKDIYMPVWKYKVNGEYKYIWIIDYEAYSDDYEELDKCVNHLFVDNTNTNSETKRIYEFCTENKQLVLKNKGLVNKNKLFDNLYFDQKENLILMLNKFKDNNMYPKKLSLDNKIGILLYGPPGTGKTGCISAIANYLNRDILLINISLSNVIPFNEIREKQTTHIIVFDEFDYLMSKNDNQDNSIESLKELLMYAQTQEERTSIIEQIKTKKTNDNTGQMLQFLDGLEDNNGRIIIATTNNPERINKTFLRPGRFDMKLELGFCSEKMFYDIVHNVYPDYTYKHNLQILLKKNITPLELINKLIQSTSVDEFENMIQV